MKAMTTYVVLFAFALALSAPPVCAAQTARCESDLRGNWVEDGCPEVLRVSRHHGRRHDRRHDRHHRHHKHKGNDGKKAAAIAAGVALSALVAAAAVSASKHKNHDDDAWDAPNFVVRNCNREARDWVESRRRGRYARLDRIQKVRHRDDRWRMKTYYRLAFENRTRIRLAT
jgi:hypothetical protein